MSRKLYFLGQFLKLFYKNNPKNNYFLPITNKNAFSLIGVMVALGISSILIASQMAFFKYSNNQLTYTESRMEELNLKHLLQRTSINHNFLGHTFNGDRQAVFSRGGRFFRKTALKTGPNDATDVFLSTGVLNNLIDVESIVLKITDTVIPTAGTVNVELQIAIDKKKLPITSGLRKKTLTVQGKCTVAKVSYNRVLSDCGSTGSPRTIASASAEGLCTTEKGMGITQTRRREKGCTALVCEAGYAVTPPQSRYSPTGNPGAHTICKEEICNPGRMKIDLRVATPGHFLKCTEYGTHWKKFKMQYPPPCTLGAVDTRSCRHGERRLCKSNGHGYWGDCHPYPNRISDPGRTCTRHGFTFHCPAPFDYSLPVNHGKG